MQTTLPVEKEKAIAAYKNADTSGKSLLADLFGRSIFLTDIKDWEDYIIPRVNSFEDACKELGLDPDAAKFSEGEPDEISYKKGKVVAKALNGPFVLTWKDGSQRKWQAWMDYTVGGFRFDGADATCSHTDAGGGSRLRLCSENLAKHFGTKFVELMTPFWDF